MTRFKDFLCAGLIAALPCATFALEGGAGRPITGQQVTSNAGVVPPTPGWIGSLSTIYYGGDLGGGRQVPLIGAVGTNLDMKISYTLASATYVWPFKVESGALNIASQFGLPVQSARIGLDLATPVAGIARSDASTDVADLLFTPIALGLHLSEFAHFSLALPIYAPTASYDRRHLSNPGQNVWTYMPTLSFTRLDGKGGEFTAMAALEYYTRNDATNYKSGLNSRIDLLWTVGVAPGWSVGVVGGLIYQLKDDEGPVAEALGGFKGRSFGLGPIASWSGKLGGTPASVSMRWVPEFDTKNRAKGHGFNAGLTMLFM
jgi:hypothetical protein